MKNYNTPKAQILTFNVLEDVLNGSGEKSLAKLYRPGEALDIQDSVEW